MTASGRSYCVDNFNRKRGITAKLKIYYPFATALVLICSRRQKIQNSRRRFWFWPLFADRATSGAPAN